MVKIGKGEGIGEWMPVSKFGFGRSGEAADAAGRAADRGLNAGFQVWIGRSHGRRTGQRQDQTISHEEKVPVLLFSCRRYPRFAPSLQDAFFLLISTVRRLVFPGPWLESFQHRTPYPFAPFNRDLQSRAKPL
jgi:hypothetical protein